MEMQQLQGAQGSGLFQGIHHIQHLAGRQTELGFLAPGILPVALANSRQTGSHANQRGNAQLLCFFQNQWQFRLLFHHDKHPVTQFLADQCQADVLPVLVAVADNHRTGLLCQRQYGHQLRFAAGFKAHLVG